MMYIEECEKRAKEWEELTANVKRYLKVRSEKIKKENHKYNVKMVTTEYEKTEIIFNSKNYCRYAFTDALNEKRSLYNNTICGDKAMEVVNNYFNSFNDYYDRNHIYVWDIENYDYNYDYAYDYMNVYDYDYNNDVRFYAY